MAIVLRSDKGAPLTFDEFDGNFSDLEAPRATAQIADDAVTAAKFDTGAVTADKIANGAVTVTKFDAGAVTTAKIGDGQINGNHLATQYHVTTGKSWTIAPGASITNNGTSIGLGEANTGWQIKGGAAWSVPHAAWTVSPITFTVSEAGNYWVYSHVVIGAAGVAENAQGVGTESFTHRQIGMRMFHSVGVGRDVQINYNLADWASTNSGQASAYMNARIAGVALNVAAGRTIWIDVYQLNQNSATRTASGNIYGTLTVVKI